MRVCLIIKETTLAENNRNKLKYEDTSHGQWSKRTVSELRDNDLHHFYVCLPHIMHDESLDDAWKVHLGLSLLGEEKDGSRRARVWDALTVLARVAPQCDLTVAASHAWSFIDSFTSDDAANAELCSVQDFLSDVRIFAHNENADTSKVALQAKSKSRFTVFTAFRAMCVHHDLASAGKRALELSNETDFVLRESGLDGISVIYTRPDCDPGTLGALRGAFSQTLIDHNTDGHWYVRKANQFALFFRDQFDKEYPLD